MSSLLYLIGYPGSGKTTAMRKALGAIRRNGEPVRTIERVEKQPFAHTIYSDGLIELGYEREVYGGTDTLSLGVQPKVLDWMAKSDAPLIIGEGDRLANSKFFAAVEAQGRAVQIVYLKCPELVARHRAWDRGSRFSEPWFKGRITKVNRLFEEWQSQTIIVLTTDGRQAQHLKEVVTDVQKFGNNGHWSNVMVIENPTEEEREWMTQK
jgi:tRNA uridine 5-carbamoylmethylation protein Kti12